MLLPMEVYAVLQKRGWEQNSVRSSGSAVGKIVFALLIEVITFHVRPTAVDVQGLGLEFAPRSTF